MRRINKKLNIYRLLILPVLLASCGNISRQTEQPCLLITFDDRHMANWEKYIPLFGKYNAKITFFVDNFDRLSSEQVESLHRLKGKGHSIGCHGLRHVKAVDYYRKHSIEKYLADEILPALAAMEEKGFSSTCFAYPSSNCDSITDNALRPYFRHVRSGLGVLGEWTENERAFVKMDEVKGRFRLNGFSFHPGSRDEELVAQAKKAIDRIVQKKEITVFYAHDIHPAEENRPGHYIAPEALEEILAYATDRKVKIISFDELPYDINKDR